MPKPSWLDDRLRGNWLFPEFHPGNRELTAPKAKVVVGQFFEVMGTTLFQGEYGPNPSGWKIHPDTVLRRRWHNRDILLEIKGGGRSYGFLIDTGQHNFYKKMLDGWWPGQMTEEELEEHRKIPFVTKADIKAFTKPPYFRPMSHYLFFVHDLSHITKTHETVDDLVASLCHSVLGAMMLPISVVDCLIDWLPLRAYTGWNETGSRGGEDHPYFVRLSAYQVQRWINGVVDVNDAFDELAAKDEDIWLRNRYDVNRYFVSTAKVLKHRVNPFMLMVMREPGSWNGKPKGSAEVKFL